MCGLTGFLAGQACYSDTRLQDLMHTMADAIAHRGPDSDGYWADPTVGIALAHRRLAIIDVSPAGAQPMVSASGRYVIVFNGEIYNHLRLRDLLKRENHVKAPWRGHSDTETLLCGLDAWGIEGTLHRAIGMFAMAVWDRTHQVLTLARDRMGEKPLYYGWQERDNQRAFLFGSELSALRRHPTFSANINRDALTLLMRYNCIGGENSIYSGIYKLPPGHLLTVSSAAPAPAVHAWWKASSVIERSVSRGFAGSPEEAVDELEVLVRDAVAGQMMSDVPLGAFLSGGIDSSIVVALMQAQSPRPVKTFTIGFHEGEHNEAVHAKSVAKHLGTDHTELYVTPKQALEVIPRLPLLYSEPFADSSQIPTYLVSQLARQHVTVSLSGDAGDELFCGYTRYQLTAALWGKIQLLPISVRRAMGSLVLTIPPSTWSRLSGIIPLSTAGDKLHKGASLLGCRSAADLYRGMTSHWDDPASLVLGATEPGNLLSGAPQDLHGLSDVERMMALDMVGFLPDDILVKVDRAAMGTSLETRVPFLDHRIVEFAWSLPLNFKLRNGTTKWPLRQVLYKYVPRELIERPKIGFGVPIVDWLRGPLRDWAENLINVSRLRQEGFFNPSLIRQKWDEHLSGKRNWHYLIWDVLMFQAWLEHNHA